MGNENRRVLLLCAGQGTRMGALSKHIPKVLVPFFEKTILEAFVDYLSNLGFQKIYVNTYHLSHVLKKYLNEKNFFNNRIILLEEEKLLNIGGAIHNLAQQEEVQYDGSLLFIGADQFLMAKDDWPEQGYRSLQSEKIGLFAIKVPAYLGHNEIELDKNNYLKAIHSNDQLNRQSRILTYASVGIVDLAQLEKQNGVLTFFESVADYKHNPVKVLELTEFEYWDLGTVLRLKETYFGILNRKINGSTSNGVPLIEDLLELLDKSKIKSHLGSYGPTGSPKTINLSTFEVRNSSGKEVIVLKTDKILHCEESGIYYNETFIPF